MLSNLLNKYVLTDNNECYCLSRHCLCTHAPAHLKRLLVCMSLPKFSYLPSLLGMSWTEWPSCFSSLLSEVHMSFDQSSSGGSHVTHGRPTTSISLKINEIIMLLCNQGLIEGSFSSRCPSLPNIGIKTIYSCEQKYPHHTQCLFEVHERCGSKCKCISISCIMGGAQTKFYCKWRVTQKLEWLCKIS